MWCWAAGVHGHACKQRALFSETQQATRGCGCLGSSDEWVSVQAHACASKRGISALGSLQHPHTMLLRLSCGLQAGDSGKQRVSPWAWVTAKRGYWAGISLCIPDSKGFGAAHAPPPP